MRWDDVDPDDRQALLLARPALCGDARWDALLGALAEHLAVHDAADAPNWCCDDDRFLAEPWVWVDLPSVRRRVLIGAPTAFRRRNVWVDRSDGQRV